MLREKACLIEEVQSAVLEHLSAQASYRFDHWKQRQDLILEHMRQVNFIRFEVASVANIEKSKILKVDVNVLCVGWRSDHARRVLANSTWNH